MSKKVKSRQHEPQQEMRPHPAQQEARPLPSGRITIRMNPQMHADLLEIAGFMDIDLTAVVNAMIAEMYPIYRARLERSRLLAKQLQNEEVFKLLKDLKTEPEVGRAWSEKAAAILAQELQLAVARTMQRTEEESNP